MQIGSHRDIQTSELQLNPIKKTQKNWNEIFLEDLLNFVEDQDNATNGSEWKLTIQRNEYNCAISWEPEDGNDDEARRVAEEPNEAVYLIIDISWEIPQKTPNLSQQILGLQRIVSRSATELAFRM